MFTQVQQVLSATGLVIKITFRQGQGCIFLHINHFCRWFVIRFIKMADANKDAPRKRKIATDDTQLLYLVTKYFKLAGVTLAIWFFGWSKFSPSWLLLGLVLYMWKDRHVKQRQHRMKMQQQMADNEKEVILATVDDLPSWVRIIS